MYYICFIKVPFLCFALLIACTQNEDNGIYDNYTYWLGSKRGQPSGSKISTLVISLNWPTFRHKQSIKILFLLAIGITYYLPDNAFFSLLTADREPLVWVFD